jgi:hypothetical protein
MMRIVTRCHWHGYWTALDDETYSGPGDPIGSGATEAEAIADLEEQLDEARAADELHYEAATLANHRTD